MSHPPPRVPVSQDYDDYRPSSRHDLFFDQQNNNPARTTSPPRQTDVYNPYPGVAATTTDDTPPIYSSKTALNPYDVAATQPYPPYSPANSYTDNPAVQKPPSAGGDYAYAEGAYRNAPSPPPPRKRTWFSRMFNGEQRFAYFCWTISIVQVGVFIGELVRNAMAMGSPIEVQPVFNPLIGPSSYVSSPQIHTSPQSHTRGVIRLWAL